VAPVFGGAAAAAAGGQLASGVPEGWLDRLEQQITALGLHAAATWAFHSTVVSQGSMEDQGFVSSAAGSVPCLWRCLVGGAWWLALPADADAVMPHRPQPARMQPCKL
jgi:hypothetical protein